MEDNVPTTENWLFYAIIHEKKYVSIDEWMNKKTRNIVYTLVIPWRFIIENEKQKKSLKLCILEINYEKTEIKYMNKLN